jgi:YjjG family noncanonical pyrimidine nucleotidase
MADLRHKKHIFFDLDDTLWDFKYNSSEVLQELYHEFSLGDKLHARFREFIAVYADTNRKLWLKYGKNEIDKQYMREQRMHVTFKKFGYDNYEENLKVSALYMERAPQREQLTEGCRETLDYLKDKYELHLITNGFTETQNVKLNNCNLRDYFKQIIISEEHEVAKPDVRIFRIAEKLSGAQAAECVMIGDGLETDIQGALAAGWEAIHVEQEHSEKHNGHSIKELVELLQIF